MTILILLMQLIMLPTWITARLIIRPMLPVNHPFKVEKISLSRWTKEATGYTVFFSIVFWYFGAVIVWFLKQLFT